MSNCCVNTFIYKLLLRTTLLLLVSSNCESYADSNNISGIKDQFRIIRGNSFSEEVLPIAKVLIMDDQGTMVCSGALISSSVILTASHCVARPTKMTVCIYGICRAVSKSRVHPGAHESYESGPIYNDVALLFLRRPITGKYFSILVSNNIKRGDLISIYGYGLDENENIGSLRKGTMKVDFINKYYVFAEYDGTTSNTCGGDSGGPAIMSYQDSNGKKRTGIVAVTSGGRNFDCSPGDLSYFASMNSSTVAFLKRNVSGLSLN